MGRTPTRNRLPPGLRARHRKTKTYYFLDLGGKPRRELSLGSDFVEAIKKWSELTNAPAAVSTTFLDAAQRYLIDVVPTKSKRTQEDNKVELEFLYQVFDSPPVPLDQIKPVHITKYIRWRMDKASNWFREKKRTVPANAGHVRANREIALFSAIFNYAREQGLTDSANPALGVRKNKEKGRDVYVEDDLYQAAWNASDQPTRDAIDLAYLCGQRPTDTLKFTEDDLRDGYLHIHQGKTKAKLRIEVKGELAVVLKRIEARKATYKISSTSLVVNEKGQPLTASALRDRFDKARDIAGIPKSQFQFRDLRAKAGTDKTESSGDIRQAQKQLGHGSTAMTEHYVRNRRGEKSTPTK